MSSSFNSYTLLIGYISRSIRLYINFNLAVDRCANTSLNDCEKICVSSTVSSFLCSCPNGEYGDGRKNGTGCVPYSKHQFPVVNVALGKVFFFFLRLLGALVIQIIIIQLRDTTNEPTQLELGFLVLYIHESLSFAATFENLQNTKIPKLLHKRSVIPLYMYI